MRPSFLALAEMLSMGPWCNASDFVQIVCRSRGEIRFTGSARHLLELLVGMASDFAGVPRCVGTSVHTHTHEASSARSVAHELVVVGPGRSEASHRALVHSTHVSAGVGPGPAALTRTLISGNT